MKVENNTSLTFYKLENMLTTDGSPVISNFRSELYEHMNFVEKKTLITLSIFTWDNNEKVWLDLENDVH